MRLELNTAYSTTSLAGLANSNYEASSPSLCQRVRLAYEKTIKGFIDSLREKDCVMVGLIIGTALLEPWSTMKSSLFFPWGLKTKLQCYGLNPDKITREQSRMRPLLLLHGNGGNQSTWIPLAKTIQQACGAPVYTVNLHRGNYKADRYNGSLVEEDRVIIENKITEIKKQYREQGVDNVQIDLGGHSRGAKVAGYMALEARSWRIDADGWAQVDSNRAAWRRDIGKVIRIGQSIIPDKERWVTREMQRRIYEIDGSYDCIVSARSTAAMGHRLEVDCGHLGLVFAPEVHEQVLRWINPNGLRPRLTTEALAYA